MNEPRKNFLGITITGDINQAEKRVPQKPLEELAPIIQAVLDDFTIGSFGWTQYTPYFNDGEPCIFSVHSELRVVLANDEMQVPCAGCTRPLSPASYECGYCDTENPAYDPEYDEDEDGSDGVQYNKALGDVISRYDDNPDGLPVGTYTGPDEARYNRCLDLERALGSGAFNDVLLEHFGDHCTVTVRREGISIEEYSHD